jgi:ABC-2 type transport system permease protein
MATAEADIDRGEEGRRDVGGAPRGEDPSFLALVRVVFHKQLLLLVRYPVNTGSQFVTFFAFFLAIFFGGQAVAGASLTDSLDGIIVGFMLWTMSIVAYSGLSWNVTREAQWGTLERLFMSPHGFGRVMSVKTAVNVLLSFFWGAIMLVLMMAVTGRVLTIDPITVVPLLLLTLAPVVGIGFAFAGLALLYKRVENLFQIVQFVFIGLIAAPVGDVPALKLLPMSHGSALTATAMSEGIPLWGIPAWELGLLAVTSTAYLLGGYACFQYAQRRSRRLGLLGQY